MAGPLCTPALRHYLQVMKRFLLPALLAFAASATPVAAQGVPLPDTAWNSARALELIQRAQERRTAANADTGLASYRSDARIFVYFYLDRPDTGERNLVKTDQLALEVYWQTPDFVKQRIVGWRDQKSLPTNINYHLDHLTVVQENFGDEIRLGDGDEVTDVVHPAASGAEAVYEYLLSDSLTLRLPGAEEPVRVYELRVRPRNLSRPGFLGSVFVERRAGDIVRMDFTFTESSYVDRYLDYINISLDNGLWRGRFWLPNQQRVEIRRRIPELDIPAGSVIRANMRIGNYRFDEPMPPGFFSGDPVVALPRAQREDFPFEEDIHAEVRAEGIGPQAELREIRRLAAELVKDETLRRSAELRFRIGSASDVFRYGRAEGVVLGAGAGIETVPGLQMDVRAGWAFGAGHPLASLSLSSGLASTSVRARFYANDPRDLGVGAVTSGALNTLSAVLVGEDHFDPYYVSGASLRLRQALSPVWSLSLEGYAERQREANLNSSFSFFGDLRPVKPIDPTDLMLGGRLELRRAAPAEASEWLTGSISADFGEMDPAPGSVASAVGASPSYFRPRIETQWGRRWGARATELTVSGGGGFTVGEASVQGLYLIGGRGTVPGYPFRRFGGDRFVTLGATLAADLWQPWLRARAFGAVGWTDVTGAGAEAYARSGARTTGALLPSLGIGAGIFHDIVRIDVARGLGTEGRWEIIVEANQSFWDFL
jgi:hypothetical protein